MLKTKNKKQNKRDVRIHLWREDMGSHLKKKVNINSNMNVCLSEYFDMSRLMMWLDVRGCKMGVYTQVFTALILLPTVRLRLTYFDKIEIFLLKVW